MTRKLVMENMKLGPENEEASQCQDLERIKEASRKRSLRARRGEIGHSQDRRSTSNNKWSLEQKPPIDFILSWVNFNLWKDYQFGYINYGIERRQKRKTLQRHILRRTHSEKLRSTSRSQVMLIATIGDERLQRERGVYKIAWEDGLLVISK